MRAPRIVRDYVAFAISGEKCRPHSWITDGLHLNVYCSRCFHTASKTTERNFHTKRNKKNHPGIYDKAAKLVTQKG